MVVITRKKIEDHVSPTSKKFWECRTYTQCAPMHYVVKHINVDPETRSYDFVTKTQGRIQSPGTSAIWRSL